MLRQSTQQLVQLSSLALANKFHGSAEVGPTPFPDSYFLILDMNGLLLEKRPSLNGRDRLYTLREDIGEFLAFFLKSFEVAFWSCCNQKNLKSMFQSRKHVCTPSWMQLLQRCRTFDQDWCDVVCDSTGALVTEGLYFFVKPLDTLFQHPDGLKGSGASVESTLLIDDSPYKNVRNDMWNAVHPLPFQSINEPIGRAWFRTPSSSDAMPGMGIQVQRTRYFFLLKIDGLLMWQVYGQFGPLRDNLGLEVQRKMHYFLRPGLKEFMEFCLINFEVIFWTTTDSKTMEP